MRFMKTIHVMVAAGDWENDRLRYRRHRLAEYLQKHPNTEEVILLCPTLRKHDVADTTLPNGIKEWALQDLFSHKVFRFGRYMDRFYKNKLGSLFLYLKPYLGRFSINLWYTFPGFPLLADLFPWNKVVYDCSDLWSSPI